MKRKILLTSLASVLMAGAAFTYVRGGGLGFLRQEPVVSRERVDIAPLVSRAEHVKIEKTVETFSGVKGESLAKQYEYTISNTSSKALTGIVFTWAAPGRTSSMLKGFYETPLAPGKSRVETIAVARSAQAGPVELAAAIFDDASIEGSETEGRKLVVLNQAANAKTQSLLEELRGGADLPKTELLDRLTAIQGQLAVAARQTSFGEGGPDHHWIKTGEMQAVNRVKDIVDSVKSLVNSGKEEQGRQALNASITRLSKYYDVYEKERKN